MTHRVELRCDIRRCRATFTCGVSPDHTPDPITYVREVAAIAGWRHIPDRDPLAVEDICAECIERLEIE